MKILFVAMGNSIHLVRWISQINDQGWELHLFPTDNLVLIREEIKSVKVHIPFAVKLIHRIYKKRKQLDINDSEPLYIQKKLPLSFAIKEIIRNIFLKNPYKNLNKVIKKIKPDIIHSMHIQEAGYLVLQSKKIFKGKFPIWIATNWGSDIDLFRKVKGHKEKIIEVLQNCDYYSCECRRDQEYAKELGFNGSFLPVLPNSGGLDFDIINKLRSSVVPSKRKAIILKGYQNWAGRALVGLRALERCSDILNGYKIYIYGAEDNIDVKIAANIFSTNTGIETIILPGSLMHNDILKMHGLARISLGLSITDAISTSMLEAMAMGSFPIQSKTACTNEWFEDKKTGLAVEPEDTEDIEKAIRLSLSDDELVDNAAKLNYAKLYEKIEKSKIKEIVISNYKKIYKQIRSDNTL